MADSEHLYRPEARLPQHPWREPDTDERRSLWASAPLGRDRSVGIVRVFERRDIARFAEIIAAIPSRRIDATDAARDPQLAWLLRRVPDLCAEGPFDVHRVVENAAGQRGVAFDPKRESFVGMHIDAWEQSTPEELARARNRLAVNVGSAARHLLFINVPPLEMGRILDLEMPTDATQGASRRYLSDVLRAFLDAFPDYPVVRLRVDPGEAYVAPTDALAHEGSTEGTAAVDRVLIVRGHFTFRDSARSADRLA